VPAWKGGTDGQTDPRNRVGEEAKNIMEEKPSRVAEVVSEQRLKPQEMMGQVQVKRWQKHTASFVRFVKFAFLLQLTVRRPDFPRIQANASLGGLFLYQDRMQ
jgi:hypothetical protein